MTSQTRTTLKTYFNTGDQPTETQFADLIDSAINIADTNPGAGTDEYALVYDHGTASFVLRAPFDGTPYALLAGRAGGQTLYGGTAANDDITIHGTSDATRTTSYVLLQPTAGNVGIGTTAPATTLHVVGAATVTGGIRPASDSTTALQLQNVAGTSILNVDTTNGRVGIGTASAAHRLHVEVSSTSEYAGYFYNAAQTGGGVANSRGLYVKINDNDPEDIVFIAANYDGDVLRVTGGGRVGIKNSDPWEALDVTGNANVTGVYKVDNVQVLSNRVIDARCADVANSGDATTDGLIDALRDAMIAHGLIAASA